MHQLVEVVAGLDGGLNELREIAGGLHPAVLAQGGLRPARKTLARRSAVPVRLDIQIDRRLPEPVDTAAYYTVAEALTNTVKHARATARQDRGGRKPLASWMMSRQIGSGRSPRLARLGRPLARLHELLVRIVRGEVARRGPRLRISGPELDDLAYQAAADALVAIIGKLRQLRGKAGSPPGRTSS